MYGVDEKVLFDTDKATIKPSAADALKQITASITQRYAGKDVRVLGFADSRGDKSYNRDLSKQLAQLSKMTEPVMLMVMGLVVGTIVSSLILPIFKLSSAVH